MTDSKFEVQVNRVIREELEPHGLNLVRRELPGGRLQFLIMSDKTDTICDIVEFSPSTESQAA